PSFHSQNQFTMDVAGAAGAEQLPSKMIFWPTFGAAGEKVKHASGAPATGTTTIGTRCTSTVVMFVPEEKPTVPIGVAAIVTHCPGNAGLNGIGAHSPRTAPPGNPGGAV